MNRRDEDRLMVLRRVMEFLRHYRHELGDVVTSEAALAVADLIAVTEGLLAKYELCAREFDAAGVAEERLTAELMVRYFNPISSVIELRKPKDPIHAWPAFSKPVPGVPVTFFVVKCRNAAAAARKKEEELRRWGVKLDGMEEMIEQLDAAHLARHTSFARRSASSKAIQKVLGPSRKAIDVVRDVVHAARPDDRTLFAEFERATLLPKIAPQPDLYVGPLQLPSGAAAQDAPQLPATTGDAASAKFVITSQTTPPPQLPQARTMMLLPSGVPQIVRTVGARISGPFKKLAGLLGWTGSDLSSGPPPSS